MMSLWFVLPFALFMAAIGVAVCAGAVAIIGKVVLNLLQSIYPWQGFWYLSGSIVGGAIMVAFCAMFGFGAFILSSITIDALIFRLLGG